MGLGGNVWAQTSVEDAIDAASGHDVVIVGESHDNPAHHAVQAKFATALEPAALVFEMLLPEQGQQVMDLRAAGADAAAQAEALRWAESGWPDYPLYAQIMDAAGAVPVFGAQVPREAARGAFGDGAAAVFGEGAAEYGLTDALPATEQKLREEMQFAAHCEAMPLEMMGGMVEAQRLRDAALARAVLSALEAGRPVLVITGNGHADKGRGVPTVLARVAPDVSVYVFGQFESEPERSAAFDGWHITPAVEREDPCAAFRKS
ncbi:hypothetical protein GO499_12410 [Algicella marina]|uniref:Haem-binding uptake Tiki superfamily ChaN domain-containing protein n=2 Tax=Algicella marina TaxID=2683284 RepID=A0A6P1T3U4_9RHOB|nr:hypothetical protein GO499_12410 [Algicella marina]